MPCSYPPVMVRTDHRESQKDSPPLPPPPTLPPSSSLLSLGSVLYANTFAYMSVEFDRTGEFRARTPNLNFVIRQVM